MQGSLTGKCQACTQGPQKTQRSHKRSRFTVRKRTMMESLMVESLMVFSETTGNFASWHSVQMFTSSETSLRKRGKGCSLATHAYGLCVGLFSHTHTCSTKPHVNCCFANLVVPGTILRLEGRLWSPHCMTLWNPVNHRPSQQNSPPH